MPFADEFIQGFTAGQRARQARQSEEFEREDREVARQTLRLQLQRMKLEDRRQALEAAREQARLRFGLLEGRPAPARTALEAGAPTLAEGQAGPPLEQIAVPGQHPLVRFPGTATETGEEVGAFEVRPRTQEEALAETLVSAQAKAQAALPLQALEASLVERARQGAREPFERAQEQRRHRLTLAEIVAREASEERLLKLRQGEIAPEMPVGFRFALRSAATGPGMSAPRRAAVIANANEALAQGNEEELKRIIRQAAVEGETVERRRTVEGRREAIQVLQSLKQDLAALKAQGVSTNILRGSLEDVVRKLGTTTDPRLAAFRTRAEEALIEYRRAMTGAVFSTPEAKQYADLFPSYRNTPPLNETLINSMIEAFRTRDRAFWEQKVGRQGAELIGVFEQPAAGPTDAPRTAEEYLRTIR